MSRQIYSSDGSRHEDILAASKLIQTIVWSIVILVILVVGILLLVHYNIL